MYKVKRFSQLDDFEDFVLAHLPKKFVGKDGVNVSDDDDLFRSMSSIGRNAIKVRLQKLDDIVIPEIKEYVSDQNDDISRLVNSSKVSDMYVFSIDLFKEGMTVSVSFKNFKSYMGWFDVTVDFSKNGSNYVSYND